MPTNRLKLALALALGAAALMLAAAATAHNGKDKTRGSFSTSCSWHCWGDGDLVDNLHAKDVWCKWDSDHVSIHLTLRNDSDHRVVATIKPSYWIHFDDLDEPAERLEPRYRPIGPHKIAHGEVLPFRMKLVGVADAGADEALEPILALASIPHESRR
jgi:hypothetical protein